MLFASGLVQHDDHDVCFGCVSHAARHVAARSFCLAVVHVHVLLGHPFSGTQQLLVGQAIACGPGKCMWAVAGPVHCLVTLACTAPNVLVNPWAVQQERHWLLLQLLPTWLKSPVVCVLDACIHWCSCFHGPGCIVAGLVRHLASVQWTGSVKALNSAMTKSSHAYQAGIRSQLPDLKTHIELTTHFCQVKTC